MWEHSQVGGRSPSSSSTSTSVLEVPQQPYALFRPPARGSGLAGAAISSTQTEHSPLSVAFFSPANMARIQVRLREIVYDKTRCLIDRQNDEQIAIIMRAMFLSTAPHDLGDVPGELKRLNGLVLQELVGQVGTGLLQYFAYIRDASTLPEPLERGKNVSVKGSRSLEYNLP